MTNRPGTWTTAEIDAEGNLTGGRAFWMDAALLPRLSEKLGKLAKAAARCGVPAPTFTVEERRDIPERNAWGEETGYIHRQARVVFHGTAPRLAGAAFIATIQHTEAGNIIAWTPEFQAEQYAELRATLTAQYRTGAPRCEHCGTVRYRIDTYLVQRPGGDIKPVGSTCLKDYIGHQNPEAVFYYLDALRSVMDDEDGFFGGAGGERLISVPVLLTHTAAMIRLHGWTPRSQDHTGGATADRALFNMEAQAGKERDKYGNPLWVDPTEADAAAGAEALTWVRSLDENRVQKSDYLSNLSIACTLDAIQRRQAGIVASAMSAYLRDLADVEKRAQERADRPESQFVGEVGARLRNLTLTVTFVKYLESQFGTTTLVALTDQQGNAFKWFGSGYHDLKPGEAVTLTGTVKGHEMYQGERQTVLTRCKLS